MIFNENIGTFDGTMYHIPFQAETVLGKYVDTLHFSDSEFAALTDAELEAQKAQRAANWVAFVTAQSNPTE